MKTNIDIEEVRRLLTYDAEIGIWSWRIDRGGTARAGTRAGSRYTHGYRLIGIGGMLWLEHRLAWLYTYGHLPLGDVDHINGIKDDNRISNLREATRVQNTMNQGRRSNNTSGHTGVSWYKATQEWQVQIRANHNSIYLGRYVRLEDAVAARKAAENKYQGEFARNYGEAECQN
jgi:hypothetical protein